MNDIVYDKVIEHAGRNQVYLITLKSLCRRYVSAV